MNRKSVVYSGVLLLALIFTSVLLNRDVVRGLTSNSDVTLGVTESTHLLGQDVIFSGSLIFTSDEDATIDKLTLRNTGPQAFEVDLPVVDTGGFIDLTDLLGAGDFGQLLVKITFNNVVSQGGGGTLSGTLTFVRTDGSILVRGELALERRRALLQACPLSGLPILGLDADLPVQRQGVDRESDGGQ